jgi:hypothetical protein
VLAEFDEFVCNYEMDVIDVRAARDPCCLIAGRPVVHIAHIY